jgi:hypothetical protein
MARNTIEKDELVKMLKRNVRFPAEEHFLNSDMDVVVEMHLKLLKEMAMECPNVTGKFLHSACSMAYEMKSWKAKLFADRLHDALAYCKAKKKSMTSGKKLSAAVHTVALAFGSCDSDAASSPPAAHRELPVAGSSSSQLRTPSPDRKGTGYASRKRVRCKSSWGSADEKAAIDAMNAADAASGASGKLLSSAPSEALPKDRGQILAMYGMSEKSLPASSHTRSLQRSISVASSPATVADSPLGKSPGGRAPEIEVESKAAAPIGTKPYLDSGLRCLVRLRKDGSVEKAKMEPGEDGFAVGMFPDGIKIKTEMPNVLLTDLRPMKAMKAMKAMKVMKAMKKKKAMKAMKKTKKDDSDGESYGDRASDEADEEEPEEEEEMDEPEEDEPEEEEKDAADEEEEMDEPVAKKPAAAPPGAPKQTYGLMWYKRSHSFGVRQKFFAKQQIFTVAHPGNDWPKARLKIIADQAIKKLNDDGASEGEVKAWVFAKTDREHRT